MTDDATPTPEPDINPLARLAGLSHGDASLTAEELAFVGERIRSHSKMLGRIRWVNMRRSRVEIPRMSIGRKLSAATPSGATVAAPEPGLKREAPTMESVVLSSAKTHCRWTLTEEFFDDCPGDDTLRGVFNMMVDQSAVDFEELALNGDERSEDKLLCANDGWLRLATRLRRKTLRRTRIKMSDLRLALLALPPRYRRNSSDLCFIVGPNTWLDIVEQLTMPEPDAEALASLPAAPTFLDIPLVMSAFMSEDQMLLSHPENLIFGFELAAKLRMSAEGAAAIYNDERYYVLHNRSDAQVQNPSAAITVQLTPVHRAIRAVVGRTLRGNTKRLKFTFTLAGRRLAWAFGHNQ